MIQQAFAIALVTALMLGSARPAFADNDRPSIREQLASVEATLLAGAAQARPNAKGDNKGLGLALIGGGATLLVLGLVTGGAECTIAVASRGSST